MVTGHKKTKGIPPSKHGQPFLRWAGSKRKLVPKLSAYYGRDLNRYIEPFVGSASLFFDVMPNRAILGDINRELIFTYREVKYRLSDVLRELGKLRRSKKTYNRLRKLNVQSLTRAQRAARFIYLNRFCFNGIHRTNIKGEFNVPYSGEKTGRLPSRELLENCSRLMRGSRFVAGDFGKTLAHARAGDFVYMDPPFYVESKRVFKEYNGVPFSGKDIQRLRDWMVRLDRKKITFLVSYAKCKEARTLSKGFRTQQVTVRRSIAGFSKHRHRSREQLITNIS